MRFHVLGIGAIGSLISHHLRRALPSGHTVTLIHKSLTSARDALQKGGVIRVENNGVIQLAQGFRYEIFQGGPIPHRKRPFHQFAWSLSKAQEEEIKFKREIQPLRKKGERDPELPENETQGATIESLFVTTKAHQTLPALRALKHRISPNSTIVLMQNGMGVYEELIEELFRNPLSRPQFILASNTHGVYDKSQFDIIHSGVGEIKFGLVPDPHNERNFESGFYESADADSDRLGRLSDVCPPPNHPSFPQYKSLRNTVAALLLMDPLNPSWIPMEEMQIAMRRKLVVNSVVNPLTAILGCKNGDIFKYASGRSIMYAVCREAARVYQAEALAEGQAYVDANGEDTTLDRFPRALTAEALQEECHRVVKATEKNVSSMLADIRKGRPVTEINYLNAHLYRLGHKYGVRTPTNATLMRMVYMRSGVSLDQPFLNYKL